MSSNTGRSKSSRITFEEHGRLVGIGSKVDWRRDSAAHPEYGRVTKDTSIKEKEIRKSVVNKERMSLQANPGFQSETQSSLPYQRSDVRIYNDIRDFLTDHPLIYSAPIEIQVQNCTVTLKGTVEDRRMKSLVEGLAQQVPGVRGILNQIQVQNPITGTQKAA